MSGRVRDGRFGASLDIDGRSAAVGAPFSDPTLDRQGSVTLLRRLEPTYWIDLQTITGPRHAGAEFGTSVAISGDRLVVGAPRHDGPNGEVDAGRVYTYTGAPFSFTPDAEFDAPAPLDRARFGSRLALFGDTLVVASAPGRAALLYRASESGWELVADLGDERLGSASAVAVDAQTVLVASAAEGTAIAFADVGATPVEFRYTLAAYPPILPSTLRGIGPPILGGVAPIRHELVSGELPIEGDFDQDTGSVRGPTKPFGTYAFTVAAVDSTGARIEKSYVVEIVAGPTTPALQIPDAVLGRPYYGDFRTDTQGLRGELLILDGTPPAGTETPPFTNATTFVGTPTEVGENAFTVRFDHEDGRISDVLPAAIRVRPVVDLSRRGRTRERLDFGPGSETEQTRVLELLAGTRLDVTLRGAGAETVALTMHRDDDRLDRTPIEVDDRLTVASGSVRLNEFIVPKTSRYFLRLTAAAPIDGALKLVVRARAPRRFTGRVYVSRDNEPVVFFVAPAGARVSIATRAEAGTAARVRIEDVENEAGRRIDGRKGARRVEGKRAKARYRIGHEDAGDCRVPISALGAAEGYIEYDIRVRAGSSYRFELLSEGAGYQ